MIQGKKSDNIYSIILFGNQYEAGKKLFCFWAIHKFVNYRNLKHSLECVILMAATTHQ